MSCLSEGLGGGGKKSNAGTFRPFMFAATICSTTASPTLLIYARAFSSSDVGGNFGLAMPSNSRAISVLGEHSPPHLKGGYPLT